MKIVRENIEFERGMDPKEGIGVGMKAKLKERSLKNLVGHLSNSKRIAAEIGGEFMYDIDLEKIYLLTKSGDVESNRKHPLFDEKMWKALEPHLSEYNIKRTRSTGAGVDTTIYETPYGKVVREHNRLGVDLYWAEFDTYMGLLNSLNDINVNEELEFERGRNPKKVMRIGGRELLKDDILGNQSGWSNPEISRAEGTLELPADDIFILGFAGEYDLNKWKFNDFTEKLENLCKEGEVIDRHKFGDNIYLLLQTDVGKIARAVLDEEGIYYYGGIEAALNLDLPNVPQSKRESIF